MSGLKTKRPEQPDWSQLACEYLEVDPDSVVKMRVDLDAQVIHVLVDRGIKGTPKYTIPLEYLTEGEPELSKLSVRDLKALAKEAEIQGYRQMKKKELIVALEEE